MKRCALGHCTPQRSAILGENFSHTYLLKGVHFGTWASCIRCYKNPVYFIDHSTKTSVDLLTASQFMMNSGLRVLSCQPGREGSCVKYPPKRGIFNDRANNNKINVLVVHSHYFFLTKCDQGSQTLICSSVMHMRPKGFTAAQLDTYLMPLAVASILSQGSILPLN